MNVTHTLRHWAAGIRLYIALAALIVTGLVIWWAHTAYAGTTLYPSRVEETFAWIATAMLLLAISIGPIIKLFPTLPGKKLLFESRRMIGLSAAWFATLHAAIAYTSQFKAANPLSLPVLYQRSFIFGGVAFIILLAMALTSFDAAFQRLGKWWFRLHRLVYIAVIAVLIHAFLTGVHATSSVTLSILSLFTIIFAGMYAALWQRNSLTTRLQRITVLALFVVTVAALGFGLTQHNARMAQTEYGFRP